MDLLVLKTSINAKDEFIKIMNYLFQSFDIRECTVDLEDKDKVLRIKGKILVNMILLHL